MLPRYNYSSKESLHFRAKIPQAKASYYQNKIYLYDVSFPERQFSKTLLDMVLHSTPKRPHDPSRQSKEILPTPMPPCCSLHTWTADKTTACTNWKQHSGMQGREQELKSRSFPQDMKNQSKSRNQMVWQNQSRFWALTDEGAAVATALQQ